MFQNGLLAKLVDLCYMWYSFDHLAFSWLCRNHAFDRFRQSFLEAYNTMDIEGI